MPLVLSAICFSANAEDFDTDAAKSFAKENNCFRCHGSKKDKDGPALNKIALKYKGDPESETKLISHLASGIMTKFPDGHEEAHIVLNSDEAQIKNLIAWILSL